MTRTRTRHGALIGLGFLALVAGPAGCKKDGGDKGEPGKAPAAKAEAAPVAKPSAGPLLRVAISVDWEGAYLSPEGLDALDAFHAAAPNVPLTHFITPGYFTKPGADAAQIAQTIKDTLRPGDEVALHIHAWRSLVTAAGVTYRDKPSFLKPQLMSFEDGDQGFEVELAAYTTEEIQKILTTAKGLLEKNGLEVAPHFRSGGMSGGPNVMAAVAASGFTTEASGMSSEWLTDALLDGTVLAARTREVWPTFDKTTQPYLVPTPSGELLELPISGGAADYVSAKDLAGHLRWGLGKLEDGKDVFVHVVFHQENAAQFAPRVEQAIAEVRGEPGAERMVFETVTQTAAAARAALKP
jgi:hypothetical protein